MKVTITAVRSADHLDVTWDDGRRSGSGRFDHVPGTRPAWLAPADELLAGADARTAGRILDAIVGWAETEDLELGLWHDDGGIEIVRER